MPGSVACPVCGVDGTSAANEVLARAVATQAPAIRAISPSPIQVQSTPVVARHNPAIAPSGSPAIPAVKTASRPVNSNGPSQPPVSRFPGQLDRPQAEHEARAKILWGDAPEEVVKFLRLQGFAMEEASAFVKTLFDERAATIRSNGLRKTFLGIGLMCVPIVAFFGFKAAGVFPLKLFGLTVAVGCYGIWNVIKGLIMFLSPRSEAGDVSEQ